MSQNIRQIELREPPKPERFPPDGERLQRERAEILRQIDQLESIKPMKLPERVQ